MKNGKLTITALILLVTAEAKKIKKLAPYELNKLDFNRLNPQSEVECIYGQMTGNCFSARANDLINNACVKFIKDNGRISSSNVIVPNNEENKDRDLHWSPIEVFIAQTRNQTNGNNKKLIAYLKGETKTLKLK